MIIKKVNEHLIDVFVGNGWNNWSRFEVMFNHGKLLLKLVKGNPMHKEQFQDLYGALSK